MTAEALQALSRQVVEAALLVHTQLGPGLLESSYTACIKYELHKCGLRVETEVPVPLVYDGQKLNDVGYRMDLLVCRELVIEVKAVAVILPVHEAQLLSYLKHSKLRLGLLLNFNVAHMRDGIRRKVNGFQNEGEREGRKGRAKVTGEYIASMACFPFAILAFPCAPD